MCGGGGNGGGDGESGGGVSGGRCISWDDPLLADSSTFLGVF